ncbi:substrate-binding periplasmic protein [Kordiimonas lacus]|uniref:Extracellular solute-binding protein, family 3 n=1 Tax=Kordiimonas lacus TaxID=637679 RepID=A0A1G6Y7B4_9PROT|nr:transporter substrate-binding domain-containing protein [Kordiimonas lacus]SDD86260.1 extracellular solute-binding protein, family 3 [Kordiimonas lacus]
MKAWRIQLWSLLIVVTGIFAGQAVQAHAPACSWDTSQTHISIVGGVLGNLIESPTEGTYVKLLERLSERTPMRYDLEVHSDKRAQRHFTDKHYDAYMVWSNFDPVLSSLQVRISGRPIYAFVQEGQKIPRQISDLEGLTVGLPFVYSFPKELTENPAIHTMRLAETAASNLDALSRGRVDVALVASGDALAFMRENPIKGLVYDEDHPIMTKETALVLQDHEALRCTAVMLQQEIEAMRADGSLARILAP